MYRESSYFLKASAHELLAPITLIQNSFEELERQNTHEKPDEKGASGGVYTSKIQNKFFLI